MRRTGRDWVTSHATSHGAVGFLHLMEYSVTGPREWCGRIVYSSISVAFPHPHPLAVRFPVLASGSRVEMTGVTSRLGHLRDGM